MVKYAGVGYHLEALKDSDPGKVVLWAKFLIAAPVLYCIAVVLPKLAILNIYLRVFSLESYRIIAYVVAGILIAGATANGLDAIFECTPVSYYWDKAIVGARCINTNPYFRWSTLPNIITDVVLLVLLVMPLPVVWRLQMSRNMKVGLTLTFLTGSIGLVTSIIRFTSFFTTDVVTDGTWASVNLMTWTVLEPGVYLIAACLLTYRPLISYFKKRDPLSSLCLGRDPHNHSDINRGQHTWAILER